MPKSRFQCIMNCGLRLLNVSSGKIRILSDETDRKSDAHILIGTTAKIVHVYSCMQQNLEYTIKPRHCVLGI